MNNRGTFRLVFLRSQIKRRINFAFIIDGIDKVLFHPFDAVFVYAYNGSVITDTKENMPAVAV